MIIKKTLKDYCNFCTGASGQTYSMIRNEGNSLLATICQKCIDELVSFVNEENVRQKSKKHYDNYLKKMKENKHGGAREGSGRKKKEPTKTIRVPVSKMPAIMEVINMGHATVKIKK